jgi:hypothetical protein
MRSLAQPQVLTSAMTAALISSLASCPRLILWANRPYVLWYLAAMLFLCGTVAWAFVFGWHTKYTHRPLFTLAPGIVPITVATVAGVAGALLLHFWLDPILRTTTLEVYPKTPVQCVAQALWALSFIQLYLIFAPFAWFMRLFQHTGVAAALTVLFGVFVMVIRNHSSPAPIPSSLLIGLLAVRVGTGALSIYFLLRGGLPLVWWWGLLLQSRHWWNLGASE